MFDCLFPLHEQSSSMSGLTYWLELPHIRKLTHYFPLFWCHTSYIEAFQLLISDFFDFDQRRRVNKFNLYCSHHLAFFFPCCFWFNISVIGIYIYIYICGAFAYVLLLICVGYLFDLANQYELCFFVVFVLLLLIMFKHINVFARSNAFNSGFYLPKEKNYGQLTW